ncbi:MAG TPA: bifunctional UDP-sugar hydrolase/5'-nucleotidase [Rectinemataceae bacterium]
MRKRMIGLALVLALVFTGATAAQAPLAKEVYLTILHTNDVHARIAENATDVGYARIASAYKSAKAWNPNTFLLDAGDVLHGLPIANIDQGESVVKLMNELGYFAMTPGNHDFNYGYDRLAELEKKARFDVLAANIYKDGERVFKPYVIQEVEGVRVAFFGLATPETVYKADPKNTEGLEFRDPVVESREVMMELAGKYDVLVLISHLGIDGSSEVVSYDVARAVPEIDVIIDGHSHSTLADTQKNNPTSILVVSTGGYGVGLGEVKLTVGKDRRVSAKSARTIDVKNSPDLKGDAKVAGMLSALSKAQDAVLGQVVAKTAVALDGVRANVRTKQTNLGTLLASGMLYVTGADIALMNGGGIRDSIAAGDVTKKMIYTVMPFGNYIQTGKVKGSELDAILENGVGKLPAQDGRYPHLAGWSFTLDVSKPAGDRVSNILVGGKPVVADQEYVLATLNFLFNGGDDYRMLVGKNQNDFPSDAEVFLKYAEYLGTITAENLEYKK